MEVRFVKDFGKRKKWHINHNSVLCYAGIQFNPRSLIARTMLFDEKRPDDYDVFVIKDTDLYIDVEDICGNCLKTFHSRRRNKRLPWQFDR